MKNKYKDYILLIVVFLIILLSGSVSKLLIKTDNKLNYEKMESNYCSSIEKDYNELLKSNEFLNNSSLNLIISKVMFRDIYEFSDNLTIYKGSNNDIKEGMPVIDDNGLIGIISSVKKNTSIVKLITNKTTNISVKINDSYGILKSLDGKVFVSDFSYYDNINIGDKIYTSGIGNIKGDIYIGEVIDIKLNETEIEKIVEVKLASNINKLNYLYVVS